MTHIDQLQAKVQFVDDEGRLTSFAFRFLSSVWERLGGPTNEVANIEIQELYPWQTSPRDDTDIIVASSNTTTTGNAIIICTSAITVILNSNPDDLEMVTVKRTTGNVTVSGAIDGDTSFTMLAAYESKTFIYSVINGEWSII